MAFFIGNSFCKLCQSDEEQLKQELIVCYAGLIYKGLPPASNAFHSARLPGSERVWITPQEYHTTNINASNLALLGLDGKVLKGKLGSNIETLLHLDIYRKRPDVNAICHTRSPYSISATFDGSLETVHAEAALILGDIPLIDADAELATQMKDRKIVKLVGDASIGEPLRPIRTIVILRQGVFGLGACVHEARAFVEILEEWARYKVISKPLGGPKHVLTSEQLRGIGVRYARSIKFAGRQVQLMINTTKK